MYRLVDHTADVAIECEGRSQEQVLADAAAAVTCVMTGVDDPRVFAAEAETTINVEAPDPEALVVAWLSEILWLLDSDDRLWISGGVQLAPTDDGGLRLTATGNVAHYDPAKHGRGTEVKAVTYHDLQFARRGRHWHLRVVLDI